MKKMEHKKAAAVLANLLKTKQLALEERQALLTAIGVLSWSYLAETRLAARQAKREKMART